MRITLDVDGDLIRSAIQLFDTDDVNALVEKALRELIQRETASRLAALGGTMPSMKQISRRKP